MASCHEVLCAIAKADLASADRKAAVRRAVEVAFLGAVALDRGGTDAGEQKQDVHDYYEHVLTGISHLAGRTKTMKVEEAKTWIRGHEDDEALKLATRLGKLSQRRNGRIHQDWLLLEAVAEMVTRAPEAPNTGGQTTGAGELAREGTAGQTRQLRRAGSEPEKEPTMHAQGGDAIIEPRQLKVQLSDASTATSVDPADEPAAGTRLHRSAGVQATVAKRRSRGVQTAGKGITADTVVWNKQQQQQQQQKEEVEEEDAARNGKEDDDEEQQHEDGKLTIVDLAGSGSLKQGQTAAEADVEPRRRQTGEELRRKQAIGIKAKEGKGLKQGQPADEVLMRAQSLLLWADQWCHTANQARTWQLGQWRPG